MLPGLFQPLPNSSDCSPWTFFNLECARAPAYVGLSAALAQLVRAPVCGAGGPWFETKRLYHPPKNAID